MQYPAGNRFIQDSGEGRWLDDEGQLPETLPRSVRSLGLKLGDGYPGGNMTHEDKTTLRRRRLIRKERRNIRARQAACERHHACGSNEADGRWLGVPFRETPAADAYLAFARAQRPRRFDLGMKAQPAGRTHDFTSPRVWSRRRNQAVQRQLRDDFRRRSSMSSCSMR